MLKQDSVPGNARFTLYSPGELGLRCTLEYNKVFFVDFGTLECLFSESDGCHPGNLEQFFLSPKYYGHPC